MTTATPATGDDAPTRPPYLGSCLCGAIRYAVLADIKAVSHCHCSMCRKAHGAAFASYGAVPLEHFSITSGAARLCSYQSSPDVTRRFCALCGSTLTWQQTSGGLSDWICLALGTLDTAFRPARQRHVHADSAVPWLPPPPV